MPLLIAAGWHVTGQSVEDSIRWVHELGALLPCCVSCLQATPGAPANVSQDVIEALTKRTQDGGTEVVNAKAGKVRRGAGAQQLDW
jgi:malate/lactate dehydrogenase